jgi:hypothetical protein
VWSADEYEKLREYDGQTWEQPLSIFQCHQNGPSDDRARLCAGWVACHGQNLLGLRIGVSRGRIDPGVLDYTTDVPIFASGAEAAEHGERDIDFPGTQACAMVAKIVDSRADARFA